MTVPSTHTIELLHLVMCKFPQLLSALADSQIPMTRFLELFRMDHILESQCYSSFVKAISSDQLQLLLKDIEIISSTSKCNLISTARRL